VTKTYLSIGDVLSLLRQEFPDITISKIRFLESQGLVNPQRSASGYRKFYEHDVERLRWVLRQQREHFLPLKVIRDRLDAEGGGIPSSNGEAAAVAAARSHQAVARTNRADVVETVLDEPAALGAHSLRPNGNGVIHPTDVVSVLAAVSAGAPERDETTHASAALSTRRANRWRPARRQWTRLTRTASQPCHPRPWLPVRRPATRQSRLQRRRIRANRPPSRRRRATIVPPMPVPVPVHRPNGHRPGRKPSRRRRRRPEPASTAPLGRVRGSPFRPVRVGRA
jgi:DNA-binding transcriptional MerR regulator